MISINNQYIGNVRLLAVEDYEENEISIVFMEDTGLDEEDEYLNLYKKAGILSRLDFNFDSDHDSYYIDIYQIEENQMIEISKIMKRIFIDKIVEEKSKVTEEDIMYAYYNQEREIFTVEKFNSDSKKNLKTILKQLNIPKISQKELEEVGTAIDDIKSYNLGYKSENEMYKSN